MEQQKNDKITVGDIITIIAILFLSLLVFFGLNFKTLGDRMIPIIVAVVLLIVMITCTFIAALAKGQYLKREVWTVVRYICLALYIGALIPCYLYSSKFLDVQFGKEKILTQVNDDIENCNRMFTEYTRICDARGNAYLTKLQAELSDEQGKKRLADKMDIDAQNVTNVTINSAHESFMKKLEGDAYKNMKSQLLDLEAKAMTSFKNWNMMNIANDAAELWRTQLDYANQLQEMYDKCVDPLGLEERPSEFRADSYLSAEPVKNRFSNATGFSFWGLIATLILGAIGLTKYFFTADTRYVGVGTGDASNITNSGGIIS